MKLSGFDSSCWLMNDDYIVMMPLYDPYPCPFCGGIGDHIGQLRYIDGDDNNQRDPIEFDKLRSAMACEQCGQWWWRDDGPAPREIVPIDIRHGCA